MFSSIFISIAFIEFILSFNTNINPTIVERNIRLKEYTPLMEKYLIPSDNFLAKTENLIQKEYKFKLDEDGYIYPSEIHKNPDLKIIFLGGSTTQCGCVEEKNRFPFLVGRMLEKANKIKVNSYNSWVGGNHTLHSIDILIYNVLRINPDVMVMMHKLNDLNTLLYEKTCWNDSPSRSLPVKENRIQPYKHITLKNIVYRLMPRIYTRLYYLKKSFNEVDEFAHLRGKKLNLDKNYILESFGENLDAYIKIAKSYGITPVLMTQANRLKENPIHL